MFWRRSSGAPVVTGTEARQGFLDRPVLLVLIVSTLLVSIIFAVMLLRTA